MSITRHWINWDVLKIQTSLTCQKAIWQYSLSSNVSCSVQDWSHVVAIVGVLQGAQKPTASVRCLCCHDTPWNSSLTCVLGMSLGEVCVWGSMDDGCLEKALGMAWGETGDCGCWVSWGFCCWRGWPTGRGRPWWPLRIPVPRARLPAPRRPVPTLLLEMFGGVQAGLSRGGRRALSCIIVTTLMHNSSCIGAFYVA